MDLKKFDTTIKSALENIEVPYVPENWDAFANLLDKLPPPDALDKSLRTSLEHIDMPYDAGTWSTLAHRLNRIARARRLRLIKMAEAVILLLLLLNFKGFSGMIESWKHPAPVNLKVQEPIAKSNPSSSPRKQGAIQLSEPKSVAGVEQSLVQQVFHYIQDVANNFSQAPENQDFNNNILLTQANPAPSSVLDPVNFYAQPGLVKFSLVPVAAAPAVTPALFASNGILVPGIIDPLAHKRTNWYAASQGSFDYNLAKQASHSDKQAGYGAGVAVGYRKGKWGIETGLHYAQKKYGPKRENVEYQNHPYYGISFYQIDQVDAELLSIPVKATRKLGTIGKTTAHAVAGVSANFAMSKNYHYQTTHYPPPVPVGGPDPNAASTAMLPNGKGLLEKSGLAHNAYATADLGLRVEHGIGKHYTAFVEPVFRQSLGGGLGPGSTRVSTFSLQAGVMASL